MAPSFAANPISLQRRTTASTAPPDSPPQRPTSILRPFPKSPRQRPSSPSSPISTRLRGRSRSHKLLPTVNVRLPPTISLRRPASPPPPLVSSRDGRPPPTELLVLAHGLQGTVEDFSYLLEELEATAAVSSGDMLVHASRVNTDKTHDGIALGGLRLAEDVQRVVSEHDSLVGISLVGFSLGGLYVRYAAGKLFDERTGLIGGLIGRRFIAVASPHLGVRKFGVYRFIPDGVMMMAEKLFGETAMELLMRDEDRLLLGMSRDGKGSGLKFVSALGAFEERYLYANVRNDFMVNYGTAALEPSVQVVGGVEVNEIVKDGGEQVDEDYDERGCRICVQFSYGKECGEEGSGSEGREEEEEENVISRRLRSVGWSVIAVDFPLPLPIAHNRIVAMSRNAIHTWMNASGRRVVHHLVDVVAGDVEEHCATFRQVEVGRDGR